MAHPITLKSVNVKGHDDYDDYAAAIEGGQYNRARPEGVNKGAFDNVMELGGNKQMLVRRTALMDPRNAARYAYKNNYDLYLGNDWDGDGINDVVLLDGNEIKAFNGYTTTKSDWNGKQKYFDKHKKERKAQSYKDFIREDLYDATIDSNQADGYIHRRGPNYRNETYKGFAKPNLQKVSAFDIFKHVFKGIYDNFYTTIGEAQLLAHTNFLEVCRIAYNKAIVDLINVQLGSNMKHQRAEVVKVLTAIKNKKDIKDALWNAVKFVKDHAFEALTIVCRSLLVAIHGLTEKISMDVDGALQHIKNVYNEHVGVVLTDSEILRFLAEKGISAQ